jgi:hypothetical protein
MADEMGMAKTAVHVAGRSTGEGTVTDAVRESQSAVGRHMSLAAVVGMAGATAG